MDIGSLFLIIALLVLVILFVSRPLMEKESITDQKNEMQSDHIYSAALAERDQILNNLHELDLDFSLGKIPAEDYPIERAAMLEKGAKVLRDLDQFQNSTIGSDISAGDTAAVGGLQELQFQHANAGEQGIPGHIGSTASVNGSGNVLRSPDDELELMLATRRRVRQEKAAGFCPTCGHAVQKTDRFCPKCGKKTG